MLALERLNSASGNPDHPTCAISDDNQIKDFFGVYGFLDQKVNEYSQKVDDPPQINNNAGEGVDEQIEKIRKENIVEGGSEEVEDNNNILVQQ